MATTGYTSILYVALRAPAAAFGAWLTAFLVGFRLWLSTAFPWTGNPSLAEVVALANRQDRKRVSDFFHRRIAREPLIIPAGCPAALAI